MEFSTNPEKPGPNADCIALDDVEYIGNILCAILDDAKQTLPSYRSTDCARDQKTICHRLKFEGAVFATTVLPKFFTQLLQCVEKGLPSFQGFKKKPQSQLPVFLGRLTDMVLNEEDHDSDALRVIYNVCVAFKKLKGDYHKSVLSYNLDKFIATDHELLSVQYTDPKTSKIIRRAKGYIDTLFKEIDIDDIIPKPGPGAVNTPLNNYMRYEPHVVYGQLDSVFPFRLWFYTNAFGFKESVRKYFALPRVEYPTSRLKFVPKYANKPRGICIEENETQYLQQGVKNLLYKLLESHPMTKGRINFKSQVINQDLALKSSKDKSLCTIDMSEASDRIPRDLVFRLFRDTKLLDMLDALSTRIITFPKEVRAGKLLVQKFAPMGSAICFPIMAVVHFALCKAIVATSGMMNARKASKRIYVYGDDILLPTEFTELIFNKLPKFGMKINSDKSYYKSSFRESCGVHAYKGKDITPVYNNYTLNVNHEPQDSTRLLSSLAKEAAYFKMGYFHTALVVRRHITKLYGQLPFGEFSSRLLCFKRSWGHLVYQKLFTRRRYNKNLQRHEYKFRVVVPRFTGDLSLLGSAALLRWFNTQSEDSAKFMDYDEQKIVHRWISESDLDKT